MMNLNVKSLFATAAAVVTFWSGAYLCEAFAGAKNNVVARVEQNQKDAEKLFAQTLKYDQEVEQVINRARIKNDKVLNACEIASDWFKLGEAGEIRLVKTYYRETRFSYAPESVSNPFQISDGAFLSLLAKFGRYCVEPLSFHFPDDAASLNKVLSSISYDKNNQIVVTRSGNKKNKGDSIYKNIKNLRKSPAAAFLLMASMEDIEEVNELFSKKRGIKALSNIDKDTIFLLVHNFGIDCAKKLVLANEKARAAPVLGDNVIRIQKYSKNITVNDVIKKFRTEAKTLARVEVKYNEMKISQKSAKETHYSSGSTNKKKAFLPKPPVEKEEHDFVPASYCALLLNASGTPSQPVKHIKQSKTPETKNISKVPKVPENKKGLSNYDYIKRRRQILGQKHS